jgi:hypothetical protein
MDFPSSLLREDILVHQNKITIHEKVTYTCLLSVNGGFHF